MFWRLIVLTILSSLHGCSQPPQIYTPIPEVERKVSAPAAPRRTIPPQVVILASEDIPAYSEVAKALASQMGQRASIVYLSASQLENLKIVNRLNDEERIQIVSIGLNASVAAKKLVNKQVVFCQVYNYQDYALLSPRHKGVSMLPSFAKTFSTWRAISPGVKNIGVISGPGFDDALQTARAAARTYGFTLHHEAVSTDKEYQYAYKNMSKKVQGYWLLPDNRVLSEHILRDIMTFSVRNSKQVVVFNDELLRLGGLLSINSDYQDIAHQVMERLDQAQAKESIPGPDMVYLDKLNLRINSVMAQRLNIVIPEQYRKYANAP
jgi:ABC-type uncharacterized transport system substrate-binding protein